MSCAGLAAVMALGARCGLTNLFGERLAIAGRGDRWWRSRRRRWRSVDGRPDDASGALGDAMHRILDAVEGSAGPVGVTGPARVDQPRASRMVAVAAGLLRRTADQADGRQARLELTRAGHTRLGAAHEFRRARFGVRDGGLVGRRAVELPSRFRGQPEHRGV